MNDDEPLPYNIKDAISEIKFDSIAKIISKKNICFSLKYYVVMFLFMITCIFLFIACNPLAIY